MNIIANYFESISEIYEKYIYEDSMIGLILNKNKIYPTVIDFITKSTTISKT